MKKVISVLCVVLLSIISLIFLVTCGSGGNSGNGGGGGGGGSSTPAPNNNWAKDVSNPVLDVGPGGSWDETFVGQPNVVYDGTTYHMWYAGHDGTTSAIGYATSTDGSTWTKSASNPVLESGTAGSWDDDFIAMPSVIHDGTTYHMWYVGSDGSPWRIGYATSTDGSTWTKSASNPVLESGTTGSWDEGIISSPDVIYDGTKYHMWYHGDDGVASSRIGYAVSSDGSNWTKSGSNPVLYPGGGGTWDDLYVQAPSVVYDGTTYHMWYACKTGSSVRIGYATSTDAINWTKDASNPVVDLGPGGSWDYSSVGSPTVIFDGTAYHMWYMGYDTVTRRIGHAIDK